MSEERILMDTAFVLALLDKNDEHHGKAKDLFPRARAARELWTTEAILVEIGNGSSRIPNHRQKAFTFIRQYQAATNTQIVNVSTELLDRALDLYNSRQDKTWGLTDCISFVVMQDEHLTDALTVDGHFQQAGFRALMTEGKG